MKSPRDISLNIRNALLKVLSWRLFCKLPWLERFPTKEHSKLKRKLFALYSPLGGHYMDRSTTQMQMKTLSSADTLMDVVMNLSVRVAQFLDCLLFNK